MRIISINKSYQILNYDKTYIAHRPTYMLRNILCTKKFRFFPTLPLWHSRGIIPQHYISSFVYTETHILKSIKLIRITIYLLSLLKQYCLIKQVSFNKLIFHHFAFILKLVKRCCVHLIV